MASNPVRDAPQGQVLGRAPRPRSDPLRDYSSRPRIGLGLALSVYTVLCLVLFIFAVVACQVVAPGGIASKNWRLERLNLTQIYNQGDQNLPWEFRSLATADVGRTFEMAFARPSYIDWIFVTVFAMIALISTLGMLIKLCRSPKKLDSHTAKYICSGMGLNLILFVPFFISCTQGLPTMRWFTENEVDGAKSVLKAMIFLIFHSFFALCIVLLGFVAFALQSQPLPRTEDIQLQNRANLGQNGANLHQNGVLPVMASGAV